MWKQRTKKHLLTSTSVALAGAPLYGHPLLYYCFTTVLLLHYWGLAGAPFTGTPTLPLLLDYRFTTALLPLYYCFTTALLGARRTPFMGTTALPLPLRLPLPLLPHPQRIHV